MKEIPIYRMVGGCTAKPTSMRFQVVGWAKVDDYWFDRLAAMGMWLEVRRNSGLRYARLQGAENLYLHQVIGGKNWDHRDGDGMNNQEENLRQATVSQQGANHKLNRDSTSGESGVSWDKNRQKWKVRVKQDRKVVFNKYFADKDEAIVCARAKRKELHGEFVRTTVN
jgi:hypothetical protein